MSFSLGFQPKPGLTFCLDTKSKQKSQDYARFTRKTYAQLAETVQTRSFVAQTGQFQTPISLVFRFTGRGQSLANRVQLNIFLLKISIECTMDKIPQCDLNHIFNDRA